MGLIHNSTRRVIQNALDNKSRPFWITKAFVIQTAGFCHKNVFFFRYHMEHFWRKKCFVSSVVFFFYTLPYFIKQSLFKKVPPTLTLLLSCQCFNVISYCRSWPTAWSPKYVIGCTLWVFLYLVCNVYDMFQTRSMITATAKTAIHRWSTVVYIPLLRVLHRQGFILIFL